MPSFDEPSDYDYRCEDHTPETPAWRECLPQLVEIKRIQERYSEDERIVMRTLPGLPTEVLQITCSFLHTKSDLAAVARTSTRLFAIATPSVYREVRFVIQSTSNPALSKMLTPENPGLEQMRSVTIAADFHDNQCGAAYTWMDYFLNAIPQNTLTRFSWDTPRPLPHRLLYLLWQRQQKLENLEVFGHYHDQQDADADLLFGLNATKLPNVKHLRLVPDSGDRALVACAALQMCPITDLHIDGRLWQEDAPQESTIPGEIHDPLTSLLFDHLDAGPVGGLGDFDALTSLKLTDLNLRFAKHTWFRYLQLSGLKNLVLEYCSGVSFFISTLTAGVTTPKLELFRLIHNAEGQGDRIVDDLDELFIAPRQCLNSISLCVRNAPKLPRESSFWAHSDSLKHLWLDIVGPTTDQRRGNSLVYSQITIKSIFTECSEITQLGIHTPAPIFEYKSFAKACMPFNRVLDTIIRELPDLETLAILNWPADYQKNANENYYASKVPQLQRLAADIFSRFRDYCPDEDNFEGFCNTPCRLEIVAFGIRDRNRSEPSPRYFVESTVKVHGQMKRWAEKRKLKQPVEQDLAVDILEHEQLDFHARTSFTDQRGYEREDYDDNSDHEFAFD